MTVLPTFLKDWNPDGVNTRISFVSVDDTVATLLYGTNDYLVDLGAPPVFSCDGTTGPSSFADSTNRWTDKSKCATRGATMIAPQSWSVIEFAGVQFSQCYQGATSDVFRLAYSQNSMYRPASAAAAFTFTVVSATDVFTSVAHGQVTGNGPFQVTSTIGLPGGTVALTDYWFIRINNDTYKIATSYENAIAGVPVVDINSTGSGTMTLTNPGPTRQPVATDECVIAAGITMVGATASSDRVYSIQATEDLTAFRCWVYRQGVLQRSFGLEQFDEAQGVPVGTVYGWNTDAPTAANLASPNGCHGGIGGGSAGGTGAFVAYLNGAPRACCGGTFMFNGTTSGSVFSAAPELNGGAPLFPLLLGCNVSGNTGWVGTRFDAFWSCSSTPLAGQVVDDAAAGTRLMWAGTMQTPWPTDQGLITT